MSGEKLTDNQPLGFYDIETPYLQYLQTTDKNVPNSDYEIYNQKRKFYYGPVFTSKQGADFYVPISHQIDDDIDGRVVMRSQKADGNLEILGNLDFRHMVPCFPEQLTEKDISGDPRNDKIQRFCKRNEDAIKKFAEKVYKDTVICHAQPMRGGSCKFEKLADFDGPLYNYEIKLTDPKEKKEMISHIVQNLHEKRQERYLRGETSRYNEKTAAEILLAPILDKNEDLSAYYPSG